MKKSKNKTPEPPVVECNPTTVEGTLQAMEQRCAAFLEALKVCAKESSKVGSGMKSKFNELTQTISEFMKTLTSDAEEKVVMNFPTKLTCCVLLEAITYANNKTKPLVAHNTGIQHLYGIIDFLYRRSALNPERADGRGISLDTNELYIYIDMLFKMFETIAKLTKVDESVHLRTVQTLLQSFAPNSPILMYEDTLRRSLQFLDVMLKIDSKVVKPIVEGGIRQLVQCILAYSRVTKKQKKKGGNRAKASIPRDGDSTIVDPMVTLPEGPQIVHIDLVVEIITSLCSIIKGDETEIIQNLEPTSAADVLLIALKAMPKGVLFEHPRLQTLAKEQLHATMKHVLMGASFMYPASLVLARIMEHGYYYSSYGHMPDRAVVNQYAALYNFVELELIETTTPEGLLRVLAWMRGFITIMQSNEMLDDICHHKTTRNLLVEILRFVVKRHRMVNDKSLDQFFEGVYKCGDGHQLLSEQIDSMEPNSTSAVNCGIKYLPIFAVELVPNSYAMDFTNMTNGVIGKTSRISTNESMDMQQLELVESGLAVDTMLTAAQMLYSCALGLNRHLSCFAPYRIFYPKMSGDDGTIVDRSINAEGHSTSMDLTSQSLSPDQWIHLKEAADILIRQFERMLNVMRSAVMQEALTAVLQALLVTCCIFGWQELYERCVEALMAYIVLVERQFAADHKKCALETWSMYLMHIRCLNALLLNYPNSLQDVAWERFMEHLIVFLLVSRRLGVARNTHLKALEPLEMDPMFVTEKAIHEEWEMALTESIGVFERLRVHDAEVLEGFLTHTGFHIVTPLLLKSHTNVVAHHGYKNKLATIKRIIDAWPDDFVNMIEKGDEKWTLLLTELTQCIDSDNILVEAEPEFLHCLFATITDFPHARQHDVVMLLTGIMICLARGGTDVMVQTVCRNIVSLCLAGHASSVRSIDAGLCVLYNILSNNSALCMDVINGLKIICTTVPQIFAMSNRIMDSIMFSTQHVVKGYDTAAIVALIDVFAAVVEDSVDFLQDDACIQFVESTFVLSNSIYNSDTNTAFRVISLSLDFAEKMAARSYYFGANDVPRDKEQEMWARIFTGMKDLGLSEHTEIRQCAIKSLALFIKGRINKFEMSMWKLCCDKMLMPLANGLIDSLHHLNTHPTIYIVCDELYVAFKDCHLVYLESCVAIMSQLITGLEKVVHATIGNKLILPNELNSALSMAIGIATNVIIDYYNSDFIWDKCVSIFQTVKNRDIDLLRQHFFKSICNILIALGEQEDVMEQKHMQIIKLALGDPSPEEWDELNTLAACHNDNVGLPRCLVAPPWVFPNLCTTETQNEDQIDPSLRADWDSLQTSADPCRGPKEDRNGRSSQGDKNIIDANVNASTPLSIYATLKLADDAKVKFTLRDKIQNSMGILQEMQLLQLVTLHYNPQLLVGTDALSKVAPLDIGKALDHGSPGDPESSMSTLCTVLTVEERSTVISNIMTHVKEPQLFALVEIYSPVSKLFRCLGTIKSPAVYSMLLKALVNKYLMGNVLKIDLALQLVDKLVLSIRDVLIRFLTEVSEAVTKSDADCTSRFLNSKVYRLMVQTIIPMVPMLFEIIKRILVKHTLQPVAIVLYQSCINMVKYIYLCLYVMMHFVGIEHIVDQQCVVDFWKALMPIFQFFAALNYNDELDTRVRYLRILHAVAIDACSDMVVNAYSVAPPFIYTGVARVLDGFANGQSAVLRRIALQRLCDAASCPFIPSIIDGSSVKICTNRYAVRMRAFLTKRFFFVLAWHVRQFLRSKDCEIEVLAALQLVETNATIPSDLIFDSDYIKKHRYLKFIQRRPLISLAMPYLLDLLESENKRVIRATRRIFSIFLEEMGAQVTPL